MADARVIIVGAGPAGMTAAGTMVAAGLRPIVIDEAPVSGGQIFRRPPAEHHRPYKDLYGVQATNAANQHKAFDALADRIDYRPGHLAWDATADGLFVTDGQSTQVVPFDRLLVASGATDLILPFEGWTTPGVYSLGAAQIALKYQACAIGRRPVFVGSSPLLYLVAYQYLKAGVPPVAVLDATPFAEKVKALRWMIWDPATLTAGLRYMGALKRAGVPLYHGIAPQRVHATEDGGLHLEATTTDGHSQTFEGDAVAVSHGLNPETRLVDILGCDFDLDTASGVWWPRCDEDGRSSLPEVFLAGDGARIGGAEIARLSGEIAALSLLESLSHPIDSGRKAALKARRHRLRRSRTGVDTAFPVPPISGSAFPDDTIICRCEAITAGDIRAAAGQATTPEINRVKAFSRIGMGRCQGRTCAAAAARIIAAARNESLEDVGRVRAQPPAKPLPVAAMMAPRTPDGEAS